ncbi:secretory carrier-associated membrane protein 3 [Alosa sapidissima]|uniref:secretory carrier-associated membrane protein 3 n=1 Tax=Alosa sapidissima TaxID=34773 RepID=UPI001C08AE15|nr:secretory carrier-associated membrane protein 3 [Alosa sapidissima]
MSKYTSFPEPNAEDQNPFQDPSVTQHSSTTGYATLDLYNPFDNKTVQPPPPYEATVPNAPPPAQTPPNRTTPTEPRNYGSYTNQNEDSSASGSYVPPILQSTASPPGDTVCVCPPTLHIEATLSLGKKKKIKCPCSLYACPACSNHNWYRPVYKAFRSDSSFNFFAFFFVFFAQVVFYVIMTIGIPGWGFSGWIVSLATLKSSVPVGVIMLLNAILFTGQAAMGVVMLKKVHSLYRQTGASFEKAQAEFATGVMSNQAVRQAAATATTSAAQSAFTGAR